jgi:hypothetical protein
VDITDDTSIAALADRFGPVDHVVSTASARAREIGRSAARESAAVVRHQGHRSHHAR